MKHYPLIIFDWDGTLVDSIHRIVTSLQYASNVICDTRISTQQAHGVIGLGLDEAVSALHPTLAPAQINAVANAYRQHFLYHNHIEAPLFPGVKNLLKKLVDNHFTLAIATGKSRQGLDHAMAEHNLSVFFSTTCCAGEYPSKPQPDMLLSILDTLQFDASQALMIGDSEHDLLMAKHAGVDSIGVTCGVQSAETLLPFTPLFCLNDIRELPKYLLQAKMA